VDQRPDGGNRKDNRCGQEMIEYTTQDVIGYLTEDYGITMEQAMEQFYMSDIFEKLSDVETGLYL